MFEKVNDQDEVRERKEVQVRHNSNLFKEWMVDRVLNDDETKLYDRLDVSEGNYHIQVSYKPPKKHRSSTMATLITKVQNEGSFLRKLNESLRGMEIKQLEINM